MTIAPQRGLLRRLGLVGLDETLEIPVLCALATGDPLLLVGPHGTAKTALVHRVAAALGLVHHTYDASKAMFEDVVGFPDPASLGEGRVRYVPTPLSIWDKELVFIDELSRAAPSMQNKWLEIVRGRTLMGLPLDRVQHVFAAMNPPSYLGANPLDDALAGRFSWIAEVPQVRDLEPDDVLGVIRAGSSDDARLAPCLRPDATDAATVGPALRQTVQAIRDALPGVVAAHDDAVCAWVAELELGLSGTDGPLDGRRLGMLRRNLLSTLAAHRVLALPVERLGDVAARVLRASLPYPATGVEVSEATLAVAASQATKAALDDLSDHERALRHIVGARRHDERITRYLDHAATLSEAEHEVAISAMLDPIRLSDADQRGAPVAAVLRVIQAVFDGDTRIPASAALRLLGWYAGGAAIGANPFDHDADAGLDHLTKAAGTPPPAESLALRLALQCAQHDDRAGRHDDDAIAALLTTLRPAAERLLGDEP